MKKAIVLALILVFTSATHLCADTVSFVPGTTYQTTALTGYSTYGDMMDGMAVTAYFAAGGSQTVLWADTGSEAGGVSGTNWSLSQSGDTWNSPWTLVSDVAITQLILDSGTDLTVFDRDWAPYPGTPGSADGWAFQRLSGPTGLNVQAIYSDLIALSGYAPVGDLYRYLSLSFEIPDASGFTGIMTFRADTDNITAYLTPVPEPSSILLLGFGLIGLAGLRRKLKR
ncbi:MAG: PEP-CTERM sorting domain-containing protein [Candidatus Omnitrophica bacterium]|nr:PEP-CTERM sorting domain-containing protein [Candidatus Omnitrophota bacterium]